MRRVRILMVLTLSLAGCGPLIRAPSSEMVAVPAAASVGDKAASSAATNPGKVLLAAVGIFSALLVLLVIITPYGGD